MNKQSIGIIGMGWVGASVAISVLQRGICSKLLVNDVKSEIAEGEAMDLNHGSSFFPSSEIRACAIDEMLDCAVIVITAGRGGKSGESRLDLLKDNIKIAENIADKLKSYQGILLIVANPVDVLTYYYQKFTGLPSSRVIGTGTMLDTARLRDIIGAKIQVDPKSIQANVIGEHGDSEVVLWNSARVANKLLLEWEGWDEKQTQEVNSEVKNAAQEIISRKGATNHAIGLVAATLIKWIVRSEKRVCNISSVQQDAYNLKEVALSLPSLIGENGIEKIITVQLSEVEQRQLARSAAILKDAIDSVG